MNKAGTEVLIAKGFNEFRANLADTVLKREAINISNRLTRWRGKRNKKKKNQKSGESKYEGDSIAVHRRTEMLCFNGSKRRKDFRAPIISHFGTIDPTSEAVETITLIEAYGYKDQ